MEKLVKMKTEKLFRQNGKIAEKVCTVFLSPFFGSFTGNHFANVLDDKGSFFDVF